MTNLGQGRTVPYDGTGVYVAVLDTGLLDSWRQYFPQERIATQFAKAFNGGGGENGNVSEPPNKWEHDQNSHGTHVTSSILGYSLDRRADQRHRAAGDRHPGQGAEPERLGLVVGGRRGHRLRRRPQGQRRARALRRW